MRWCTHFNSTSTLLWDVIMDYEYFEKEKNLFVKGQTFFPTSSSPLCAAASFINSYLAKTLIFIL